MEDTGKKVARIMEQINKLMVNKHVPGSDMKKVLKRLLPETPSSNQESKEEKKYTIEELEQLMLKSNLMEEEEIHNLIDDLRKPTTLSEDAYEELDSEFIELDRFKIHEYCDPDSKEILKNFFADYNKYRDVYKIYIEDSFDLDDGLDKFGPCIFPDGIDTPKSLMINCIINWLKLSPAFVFAKNKLDNEIKRLFEESRKCFVFNNYLAVAVLCRAVLERTIKIAFKDDLAEGQTLADDLKQLKKIYHNNEAMSDILSKSTKVKNMANDILHKGVKVTDEDALFAINNIRILIEKCFNISTGQMGKTSSN